MYLKPIAKDLDTPPVEKNGPPVAAIRYCKRRMALSGNGRIWYNRDIMEQAQPTVATIAVEVHEIRNELGGIKDRISAVEIATAKIDTSIEHINEAQGRLYSACLTAFGLFGGACIALIIFIIAK